MLLFEDFLPQDRDTWQEAISKELKGKKTFADLCFESYEGISVEPFYLQGNATHTPLPASLRKLRQDYTITLQDEAMIHELIYLAILAEVRSFSLDIRCAPTCAWDFGNEKVELFLIVSEPKYLVAWVDKLSNAFAKIEAVFYDPYAHTFLAQSNTNLKNYTQTATDLRATYPEKNFLAADFRQYANAGAHAALEGALALSWIAENLNHAAKDTSLHALFSIGKNYFVELAKFRAIRKILLAQGLTEKVQLHAQTGIWNKTTQDPHTNLLRQTTEAMAAILGGCATIGILPYDAQGASSNPLSDRLARNIHHLLTFEAHLLKVNDPAAGAYFVEHLTDGLILKMQDLQLQIQQKGGLQGIFESNWIFEQISQQRAQKVAALQAGKETILGINKYARKNFYFDATNLAPDAPAEDYFRLKD